MKDSSTQFNRIHNILEHLHGQPPRRLRLQAKALRGGLESLAVFQVTAGLKDNRGRRQTSCMVVKRLAGIGAREAAVYEKIVVSHAREIAPHLLAVDHSGNDRSTLYLEWVRRFSNWPWRELSNAEELMVCLARLHIATAADPVAAALPPWNYEAELTRSSENTLEMLARCRRHPEFTPLAQLLPTVQRLTESLPALGQQLLGFVPLGRVPIHGDVHPDNVLVPRRAGKQEPILSEVDGFVPLTRDPSAVLRGLVYLIDSNAVRERKIVLKLHSRKPSLLQHSTSLPAFFGSTAESALIRSTM